MLNNTKVRLPQTLSEATALYKDLAPKVKYIAGGTDVMLEENILHKDITLVSLNKIKELKNVYSSNGFLHIGSMSAVSDLQNYFYMRETKNALLDGLSAIGSPQIRNVATLGGNICSSLPSADSIGPLIVLEAKLVLANGETERKVNIENFCTGVGKNILAEGEILKEIIISEDWKHSAYIKHGRRKSLEIALVGAACKIKLNADSGACDDIKIALTTAAPLHVRALHTEDFLRGKNLSDGIIDKACDLAILSAQTRTSFRCTSQYRNAVIPELVKRAIYQAIDRR